LEVE
jgi:hypothetical protein